MKWIIETFSKTNIANILGIIFVIGCFILIYILTIKEIPKENVGTVNQAIGLLFGCLTFIMGYFYGASKSNNQNPPS